MRSLSLTDFVDIVAASGTPKLTKIRNARSRGKYDPATDFYKQIREGIVQAHEAGAKRSDLSKYIRAARDSRKQQHFDEIEQGYRKWWGRKTLGWFDPPRKSFTLSNVTVRVNPELGLSINGDPHVIKLSFKAEKLTSRRVELIGHLMSKALPAKRGTVGVLDVRRAKLFTPNVPAPDLDALLAGEFAYIAAVWDELDRAP